MAPRKEGVAPIRPISGGGRSNLPGLDTETPGAPAPLGKPSEQKQVEAAGTPFTTPQGGQTADDAAEALKARLRLQGTRLAVEKDEESGEMVVKVMDPESGEVIRQLPAREMLKIAESIDRYLGLMVDKRS